MNEGLTVCRSAVYLLTFLSFVMLVLSVRQGSWIGTTLAAWFGIFSLVPLLAFAWEHRVVAQVFNLHTQSWAFLIGDPLFLTGALAVAALAWRQEELADQTRWWHSWWWTASSLVVGAGASFWFRTVEIRHYVAADARSVLDSPSKLGHDFGLVLLMVAALTYSVVPLLRLTLHRRYPLPLLRVATWHPFVIILLVAGWFAFTQMDISRGLNLYDLHPNWSW